MRALPFAAALFALAASGAQAGALSVAVNHSVRLPLAGPAQSVVVGSPSVVDVTVVDSRTVYLSGRSPGDTDVTVVDPLGRTVYHGDVVVPGGASVSVFRGAVRSDATCAPSCRTLPADSSATAPAGSVAAAAAPAATSGMGMGVSPQTIASVPPAPPISH